MFAYLNEARHSLDSFVEFVIKKVPRMKNAYDDAVAHIASTKDAQMLYVILMEFISKPIIDELKEQAMTVEVPSIWMDPIVKHLKDEGLPKDKA